MYQINGYYGLLIFTIHKYILTTLEYFEIAGFVKGSRAGEGLGNQFLSHIRRVDAILHFIRCFDDSNIIQVSGFIEPIRDIEIVETELLLKDI